MTCITIGIPTLNASRTIARTLVSVVNQTRRDYQVIISDNASEDATETICRDFTRRDPRFRYIRQRKRTSAAENFKCILQYATTKLFVFLASDDYWEPDFLECNIENLQLNPDAVASISHIVFESKDGSTWEAAGTVPITGNRQARLQQYLRNPSDNSRFYSVFRTNVLKRVFMDLPEFHAADWYLMAKTLMEGEHVRFDRVLMHREETPLNRYHESVENDNRNHAVMKSYPLLPMSLKLLTYLNAREVLYILPILFQLNRSKHRSYVAWRNANRGNK